MIKAVVFDLDDTLFPEIEYVKTGFACVEKFLRDKVKVDVKNGLLFDLFVKNKSNVYNRALELLQIDYTQSDIEEIINVYRNHIPNGVKLFDDVLTTLNWLKENNFKIGMITDGRPLGQNNKINALGIIDFFDKIIITDELGIEYRKPHPKAFMLMAEALCVKYEEMLYIGDNPQKDFAVMKDLPVYTIQVLHSDSIYEFSDYLFDIKPNKVITCFKQLIGALGEL